MPIGSFSMAPRLRLPRLGALLILATLIATLFTPAVAANAAAGLNLKIWNSTAANVTSYSGGTLCSTSVAGDINASGNWGGLTDGNPCQGDYFYAQYTGFIQAPTTGTYTFKSKSDDGFRLYVDNTLIIEDWATQGPATYNSDDATTFRSIDLVAGQYYPLEVQYYEYTIGQEVALYWEYPGQTIQLVPSSAFTTGVTVQYHANGGTGTGPLAQTKEYGTNLTLAGSPNGFVRSGYSFAGWNTSADGTGTSYAAGAAYSANQAATMYAVWEPEVDYAMVFDGSADYVATPDNFLGTNTPSALTIALWLKYDDASPLGNDTVFRLGYSTVSRATLYIDDGVLSFVPFAQSSGSPVVLPFSPDTGSWHHYAMVYDESAPAGSIYRIYVDGVEIGAAGTADISLATSTDNRRVFFGGYAGDYLEGQFDEIKIFTDALSASEIESVMHGFGDGTGVGSAGYDDASLVAYYSFNSQSGIDVDTTGLSHNLTIFGSPTYHAIATSSSVNSGQEVLVSFPRSYITSLGGWSPPENTSAATLLAVGGGGAGGSNNFGASGGGGGGRVIETTFTLSSGALHEVVVGQGGVASKLTDVPTVGTGSDGQSSEFGVLGQSLVAALGGGAGANSRLYSLGQPNPSTSGWTGGGGSAHASSAFSSGSIGLGGASFAGGDGHPSGTGQYQSGGGGGGAASSGLDGTNGVGGDGGSGAPSTLTAQTYGGGGGGGLRYSSGTRPGSGGTGGGGAGGTDVAAPQSGVANTGGGGGGAGEGTFKTGGFGGSGFIAIQYVVPTIPAQVANLAATTRLIDADSSSDSVDLTWTAQTGHVPPVSSYSIEWDTNPSFTSGNTPVQVMGETTSSATVSGLTDGANYYFRISALNAEGTGPASTSVLSEPVSAEDFALDFDNSVSNPATSTFASSADGTQVIPADGNFTVEAWIKPRALAQRTDNFYAIVTQNQDSGGTNDGRFFLSLHERSANGRFEIHVGSESNAGTDVNYYEDVSHIIRADEWAHIALTSDSSSQLWKLYINGVLFYTSPANQFLSGTASNLAGFHIGSAGYRDANNPQWHYFNGQIDQVKVWDAAMSGTQLVESMHSWGSADVTIAPPLLAHYDFNDFTNTSTLKDQASSFDLTVNNVGLSDLKQLVQIDTSDPAVVVYDFKRSYLTRFGGWTVPSAPARFNALVVGGGGGGAGNFSTATGSSSGSGGGGGVYNASSLALSGVLPITVGLGGLGGITSATRANNTGYQGQSSSLSTLVAGGGGAGGCSTVTSNNQPCSSSDRIHGLAGTASGSGGSASNYWNAYNYGNPGTATAVTLGGKTLAAISGYAGGTYVQGSSVSNSAGSAGGAGGVGTYNTPGAGVAATIPGISGTFGTGGASWNAAAWTGTAPAANTGAGGSGAYNASATPGFSGSSGRIVVSYLVPSENAILAYNSTDSNSYDFAVNGSVTDLSGNGVNGTAANSLGLDATTHAWSFPGGAQTTTAYIDIADITTNLLRDNGFTFDFEADFGSVQDWERIIDFSKTNSDKSEQLLIARGNTTQDLALDLRNGDVNNNRQCRAVNALNGLTGLHRYTISVDGSNCTIYRDGTQIHTQSFDQLPSANITYTSNFIGRSNWTETNFEGQIRSLRIYKGAFTPSEIGAVSYKTVTLDASPGTVSDSSLITSGSVRLPEPTRSQYTNEGWYTDLADASSKKVSPFTPSADVTLLANWEPSEYVVTWDSNGGSSISPSTNAAGTSISKPADPTRTGYRFDGWSTSETSDQGDVGSKISSWPYTPGATSAITLYAIWHQESSLTLAGTSPAGAKTSTANLIPLDSSYTWEAWIKPTALPGTGTRYGTVLDNIEAGNNYGRSWMYVIDSGSGPYLSAGYWTETQRGGGFASAAGSISYDSWNHVAVTYERTGSAEGSCSSAGTLTAKLYINGELAATPSTVNSFSGCLNNDELGVGYNIDDNSQQFPGQIDQVKIWSGVLTQSEIQSSMKSYQLGTVDNSMIAHFDFNQLSSNPVFGDTIPNRANTGSGYDLSLFANTQSHVDSYVTRTANQFTVSFDGNSATTGSVTSVPSLMPYDSFSIPSSGTLQRTGYAFTSWNTAADGTGTTYSPGDAFLSLYGDTTLYATWAVNTYTITYNYNGADGGTRPVDSTYDLSSPQAITLPTPTKSGLIFGGWYSDAGLSNRVGDAGASYTPTADITLYARWTNLLINLDGTNASSLTNSGTTWTSITPGASGAQGTALGDAAYFGSDGNPEGFVFDGDGDAIRFPLGTQNISGEMTLETWINPSNLRMGWNIIASNWFDVNGGSSSGNFDFHLAIKRDSTDGKYKLNLYTSTNGTSYQSADIYGEFSFGLNKWYLVGFTINASNELQFYINGETDGPAKSNVQHVARSSYLYLGDARSSIGLIGKLGEFRTYNKALSASEMESSFTTRAAFYGYSTISFQAGDNGSGSTVSSYKFDGDSVSLPSSATANTMFTRANFSVSGWSLNSDGSTTDYALGATYSTDADLTLYPVWQPNTQEITFNANDGTGTPATASQTVNTATATALTSNSFSRSGYTFAGWNTQANGQGTDFADGASVTLVADLTLYAKWTPVQNRFANLTSGNPGSGGTSGESFKYAGGALLPADRSSFTVEVWFKEKAGTYVYSGQNPILTQGVDGNSEFTILASGQGSARQLYVYSGGSWATTGISLALDQWYHLAYAYDSGTYYVYLDGVLADTGSLPEGANVGNFYLGENAYYAAGTALQRHVFHGYLDQLKIWSKALTISEVQASMHAWGDAGISNLIHHYSFDDVASPGKDYVGSSNLTLSGVGSGSTPVSYANFDLAIRTPSSRLSGEVGNSYSLPAFAPGGNGVKTFEITTGTLPAGLSISSSTGLISGTPTVAGDQAVVITVTDEASGSQATASFTISISATLSNIAAPTVAATSQTLKSIDVSWTAVPNASSYTLKIYNAAGTTLLDSISLSNSLTSYTVTAAAGSFESIADGATYQLSLTAVGTGNYVTSDESAKSSVTTLAGYAVSYDSNGATGGTAPSGQVKIEGLTLQLQTNSGSLVRTGFTFAGWNTQADGSGADYATGASYSTDSDLSLFAKWSPDIFTITYNYNGADGGTRPASDSYTNGGTAIALPVPTKSGYNFGGWYDNSGLTGSAISSPYSPSADITLYAKWTGQTYTVNFSYFGADGGDSQASDTFTVGSGSPITLPTPTKTGYTFAGWYSGSFATLVGAAGASYSPTQNLTLSAKWTAIQYSVTYNADIVVSGITYSASGDVPVDANTYTIGSTVPVLPNAQATPVTRLGYTFVGWVTNADGTGTALNSGQSLTMGSADVNLYPKWTANTYSISYNLNGGTGSLTGAPTSYTVGGNNVSLPNSGFTKTGFDFVGWTKTQGSSTAISNSFSTFANVTLYAIWQIKSVPYTFDDGIADKATLGVTWPSNSAANFGSSVTLPDLSGTLATVGADQYLFFGWSLAGTDYSPGASFTMGETAAAFVAEWVMVRDVRYSYNGGTHSGSGNQDPACLANSPQLCTVGQNISLRTSPSRSGYEFLGWKVQDKVTVKPAGASHAVANDEYLFYAQWQAIDYTISFNSVGGSNNFADYTRNIGQVLTLPNPGAKPHHTFAGWTNDSGVTLLSPNATFVVGASSEAFEAVWTPNQYRVTYDWQGAVGTPEADGLYTFGSGDMNLPNQGDRVRDGYNFAGWSTSPSGTIVSGFQPTADTVLYAQWSNGNFALTFVPKGGTMGSTSASVPRGSTIQLPTPSRTGFVFLGWYDAVTNGTKIGAGGAIVTISASGSLYAGWVQRSLHGVDEATLETSQIYTASDSTAIDTTITHGPSSSSARVQVPAGALTAGTQINVRFFRDTQRQQALINNQHDYVLSVLVSWLYGSGDNATVPDTDPNKPITVTLSNSQIRQGAMIYKVIGDQITELGRAQSDGVVTVELFEDPEIVIAITAPDAPQSVTATAGDRKATVSWTLPASDGGDTITGYTVTANTGESCTWTSGPLTCEVTGLTNGTNYTFSVVATNSIGNSSASTATATPTAASAGTSSSSPSGASPGPAAGIEAVSGQSWAWTKRISKNQVKVYIKFPEMGANYQVKLQKNDGNYTRKISKTINSTADTDLRVVGEWYYLVRTITLPGEGRYRIEITQDGQRMTLNSEDRPAVYNYR